MSHRAKRKGKGHRGLRLDREDRGGMKEGEKAKWKTVEEDEKSSEG